MRSTAAQASCRKATCAFHFGLGKADVVDIVEVKWPTTQKIEKFTQIKANQILTIREGDGIVAAFQGHYLLYCCIFLSLDFCSAHCQLTYYGGASLAFEQPGIVDLSSLRSTASVCSALSGREAEIPVLLSQVDRSGHRPRPGDSGHPQVVDSLRSAFFVEFDRLVQSSAGTKREYQVVDTPRRTWSQSSQPLSADLSAWCTACLSSACSCLLQMDIAYR